MFVEKGLGKMRWVIMSIFLGSIIRTVAQWKCD